MIWITNASPPIARHVTSIAPWLRALISLTCVLGLTSCARGTMATRPTIPAELLALLTPIPTVDQSLTGPCPPLPTAADDRVPTLLRNHAQTSALYHACASRHAGLSAASRERERIESERVARAAAAMRASGE